MPASPLFSLLAPNMAAPSSGVLNQASATNNGGYNPLQPTVMTPDGLEQTETGLSFFQQFQMANQSSVLPMGQELAAYLPQTLESADGKAAEFDTDFIGPLPLALQAEHVSDHASLLYAPLAQGQVSASETKEIPQGLQYLESLRRAQPHVQANTGLTEGAVEDSLGSDVAKQPLTQANADTRLQAMSHTAPVTPHEQGMNPATVMTAQANKTINLDELGMEAVSEDMSLDSAKLDTRVLHETPMTLKTLKETVAAAPLTQPLETTVMQDAKAGLIEMPAAMPKDTLNTKSLALEQGPTAQTQNTDKPSTAFNKLDVPPQHPQWNDQVAKRISIMANESVQSARIQLDPPELGALEIKVKVQHDQVSVTFGSNNQQVRDALEAQAPRLRESLEQQGINLADVNVSEQGAQQGGQAQGDASENAMAGEDGDPSNTDAQADNTSLTLESDSLVDYFA